MKKIIFLYPIFVFIFLISCNSKTEIKKGKTISSYKVDLDTLQYSNSSYTVWNKNTCIGEGMIYREGNENKWTKVSVINIFGFKKNLKLSEYIQVIPLRKNLPILELKITNTVKRNDIDESDKNFDWYEISLEDIKNKEYFTINSLDGIRSEYPTEVLLVYPAIKNAVLLVPKNLTLDDLPTNVSINSIKGAIDFNMDGKAEAIVCSFCCENRDSKNNCEYYCGETYLKINKEWVLVNTSQPL